MLKKLVFAVLLLCAVPASAGERIYFSPDGKQISAEEYANWGENLKQEQPTSVQPVQINAVVKTVSTVPEPEKDRYGRPLKDKYGRWITYPGQEGKGAGIRTYSQSADEKVKKEKELEEDVSEEFVKKEKKEKSQSSQSQTAILNTNQTGSFAVDQYGTVYTGAGNGNLLNTKDGTMMIKTGGGYINTRTGAFAPGN